MTLAAVDLRSPSERLPNSMEAEQGLLGCVLFSPQAGKAVSHLAPEQFYEPVHQAMFGPIKERLAANELVDPVWLAERLKDNPAFQELGGLNYLSDLILNAPAGDHAALAVVYAGIVSSAWTKREAIRLCADAMTAAKAAETEGFNVLHDLRTQLERLEADAAPDDASLVSARDAGFATVTALETEIAAGKTKGLSTGISAVDRRLGGLLPESLVVIAGRPGMGKAQPLGAKVLMRDGTWKRIGDLRIGEELASVDGAPSRVAGVYPQGIKDIYRLTTRDGRSTRACADHLWAVDSSKFNGQRVLTTAQIREMLESERYQGRMYLPLPSGHFGVDDGLLVDPWLLGAFIGNGCTLSGRIAISTADAATLYRVQKVVGQDCVVASGGSGYDYALKGAGGGALRAALRTYGLMRKGSDEKFIPPDYLRASRGARLELLRGLLDTDGWVETFGVVRYSTASPRLAEDIKALVRSLGGTCTVTIKKPVFTHKGERRFGLPAYICNLRHPDRASLISLKRKQRRAEAPARFKSPSIVSVEPDGREEAVCIRVTHPSFLYITDDYLVTHNTALLGNVFYGAALHNPNKLFAAFSLEMSSRQLSERALSRLTATDDHPIPFERIGKNATSAFDLRRLHEVKERLPSNLYLRDRAGLSLEDVHRVVWALKRRGDLGAIGIDYLQIMRRPRADGRNEASVIGQITTGLKTLAREAGICIVLLSQLSRQVEQRDDKRPQLSDLRESGSIEQDADAVLFPFREVYYLLKNEPREGTAQHLEWEVQVADKRRRMDVIIGKNRHGGEGIEPQEYDAEVDLIQNWGGSR